MQIFTGIVDLEAAEGSHLGHGDWYTVTQEQIDAFADATGDHQWIHVDAKRAAGGPFGATIAHGFLTLSLIPLLVRDVYRVDGLTMRVNYGSDRVRFPAPVAVGSRLRGGVKLVRVSPSGLGFQVLSRVTVELDGSERPACVADMLSLLVA